jgi:DNA-binding beta-propeller fold protein YncE
MREEVIEGQMTKGEKVYVVENYLVEERTASRLPALAKHWDGVDHQLASRSCWWVACAANRARACFRDRKEACSFIDDEATVSQAFILTLALVLARAFIGPASTWQGSGSGGGIPHPIFVRQFASAEDIKREHPILNRSLDIIAGPKDAEPQAYALQEPSAITTDARHRIFVSDVRAGVVHVFDFANARYSQLRGGDPLRLPMAIAADPNGNIYVSDGGLQTVLVYDSRGKFIRPLKKMKGGESFFDGVRGIAVDPTTGRIYVCDKFRHMVFALDQRGRVVARYGKRFGGDGPGEFRSPIQVVVLTGEIVVLDSGNHRIQILSVSGRFLKQFSVPDAENGSGLAMDDNGNIYVSDPQLNHVQVFNHDGQSLYAFGEAGTGAGQFSGISGIWVDSGHCLYAADSNNKRVQLFHIAGPAPSGGC